MKRKRTIGMILLVSLALALTGIARDVTKVKTPQQARLMAKRAAINDAQRNLAEIIYGIRLDSKTTVRNFITTNDRIRTSVWAVLRGARVTRTKWDEDGTCTVKMELPVTVLRKALRRRFAYTSDIIRATGHGVPNPVGEETPSEPTPSPEESWYTLLIKATGAGVAPPDLIDTPQGKLMAERAAYADALRQLGENIKGVHITSRTTVRNFVTQNDRIRTRFQALLRGAKKVETRHLEDGTCEVDVEIPLEGLRPLITKPRRPPRHTQRYREPRCDD